MPDVEIQGGGPNTAFTKNLQLGSLAEAKLFFADVIESYSVGGLSERNLRALVYALSNYLPYLRLERDMALEAEIEEIKRRLEEAGR